MKEREQIVIVGAGFGGLWAARALARAPVTVTLVDKNNYHGFWPLLYQVAAAELEAEQIGYPIRRICAAAGMSPLSWAVSSLTCKRRRCGQRARR